MKTALIVTGVCLLALSALLLRAGLIQLILPEKYDSVARITVQPQTNGLESIPPVTEVEEIQSKRVLYQVVTNLDLNQKWGEKYKMGVLRTEEAYGMLRLAIEVKQERTTGVISVRARSDDPEEAAAIANGIAQVYSTQHAAKNKEMTLAVLAGLHEETLRLRSHEEVLEAEVKELGARLNLTTDSPLPTPLEKDNPRVEFVKVKRELELLKNSRKRINDRLVQERINAALPQDSPVQVVDQAEPNLRPAKPGMVMKICMPLAGLLAGILGVVCLVLAVILKRPALKTPPLV